MHVPPEHCRRRPRGLPTTIDSPAWLKQTGRPGTRTTRLPPAGDGGLLLHCGPLRQAEDEDRVAERIAQLEVAAACDGDKLLTAVRECHRSGVAAGAAVELPEQLASLGVVGVEVAIALAGEGESPRRGERTSH